MGRKINILVTAVSIVLPLLFLTQDGVGDLRPISKASRQQMEISVAPTLSLPSNSATTSSASHAPPSFPSRSPGTRPAPATSHGDQSATVLPWPTIAITTATALRRLGVSSPAATPLSMSINASWGLNVTKPLHVAPQSRAAGVHDGPEAGEFGAWDNANCSACNSECYRLGTQFYRVPRNVSRRERNVEWIQRVHRAALDRATSQWTSVKGNGNITLRHHVLMLTTYCGGRSVKTPIGFMLHVSGFNVTVLHALHDKHGRTKLLLKYVTALIKAGDNGDPLSAVPFAFFFSLEDAPCGKLPYFTLFSQRRFPSFVVPDIFLTVGLSSNWTEAAGTLVNSSASLPFYEKKSVSLFSGAPTHPLRQRLKEAVAKCCSNVTRVNMVSFAKPSRGNPQRGDPMMSMAQHAEYKYLFAVRGKSASIRDKYLLFLNSTMLWVLPDTAIIGDETATHPYFQYTHALLRPFVHYVPFNISRADCTLEYLNAHPEDAQNIAGNAAELIATFSQATVDRIIVEMLQRYIALQAVAIPASPRAYVKALLAASSARERKAGIRLNMRKDVESFGTWCQQKIESLP